MITTSTKKQWDEIAALRESIIAGITEQPDDESVRDVVRMMWQRMGVKPQAVLIANCPMVGALFFCWLSNVSSQLYSQLDSQLHSQLYSQLFVSIWWRAWSGWYEGARILGVNFDLEKYVAFLDWTLHVPAIYANAAIPIVSRFPSKVHWRNGLLHNEAGKSVEFRSGWGLWTINGIPVNEQIVMKPETQTIDEMDSEKNQDVRAIRIERFGWPRYLKESGAKECDHRKNEVDGTMEALFRCRDGSQRLVVTCPTARIFALGVPSDIRNCEQAQRWLAGGVKMNVIAAT